jgi:hypothetical protein
MNQPIIFDMHVLAAQGREADTGEPSFVDKLLDGVLQLPTLGDDTAADLLSRAAEYDETQPAFAAELRVAAQAAAEEAAAV